MVISVENISKEYRLGVLGSDSLKEDLSRWWRRSRDKPEALAAIGSASGTPGPNRFKALRDVSFQVNKGEVLGLIGRNGAGKSTLLKILSQVTAPTEGEVKVKGRIASLLEVGTGFHPDLTGRENIYLNGAILGMKRPEIRRKFDEIVAFAGIADFLESPVKRYSSGMYVRLAFAVAAHLDPEILIIDEVLAVGDAEFQKRCIGKMQEVSTQEGRTVVFVSHNIGMITSLCSRAILLDKGAVVAEGNPSLVATRYFSSSAAAPHIIDHREKNDGPGDHLGKLSYACVEKSDGTVTHEVRIDEGFAVRMDFEVCSDVPAGPHPNFHFFDSRGEYAFVAAAANLVDRPVASGLYTARCFIPPDLLNNGIYTIGVALTFMHAGLHVSFYDRQGISVSVVDPIDETLLTSRAGYVGPMPGPIRPRVEWRVERL